MSIFVHVLFKIYIFCLYEFVQLSKKDLIGINLPAEHHISVSLVNTVCDEVKGSGPALRVTDARF